MRRVAISHDDDLYSPARLFDVNDVDDVHVEKDGLACHLMVLPSCQAFPTGAAPTPFELITIQHVKKTCHFTAEGLSII